jgi:chorismate synthase
VIDGCPPRILISKEEIQFELDRRRPGQSKIVTPRKEDDQVEILSGHINGQTLGSTLAMLVRNTDQRSSAYTEMQTVYRPSHADYTYDAKYGIRAVAGGGRSSARETIGRVAAGAVAQKVLKTFLPNYDAIAYVKSIQQLQAEVDTNTITKEQVESNIVRTTNDVDAQKMIDLITEVRSTGNSIGGVIECVVRGVPAGLGEPVFDKLDAELAKAMLSLPATKGFEVGSGFAGTLLTGKEHNDEFYNKEGRIATRTNRSGGVQGGISNGEPIIFRVAFKPTATILQEQKTVDHLGNEATLAARGRHDACVLPRAVPMVEAMVHLVMVDLYLRQQRNLLV